MRFLQDITFGQYIRGASMIHRLDPRAKLVSVSILLPLIFTSRGFFSLSILTVTAFTAIRLSGIPAGFVLRGLRHFFWLFLFAAVFHAFFTPGEPIPYLRWISYEGMDEGAMVMVQLILAIVFSNLLTLTTPPLELTMGLERLLSPLNRVGIPVSDLAMMMLVAIRFIPILKMEAEGIVKAQKGRGVDFSRGGLIERAKAIPAVLVPLIYNSFGRADDLAVAMVSRGYVPGGERGSLKEIRFGAMEYGAVGFVLVLCILLYLQERLA
jgi:energy-coupling factor transport system permease protein